jgi:hypothetical protein
MEKEPRCSSSELKAWPPQQKPHYRTVRPSTLKRVRIVPPPCSSTSCLSLSETTRDVVGSALNPCATWTVSRSPSRFHVPLPWNGAIRSVPDSSL